MMWIYFALAIILLILELTAGIVYFAVLSLTFFITGLYVWVFNPSLELSIAIASILSLIGVVGLSLWKKKTNSVAESDILCLDAGQVVVVESHLANGRYQVRYRGTLWEALFDDRTSTAPVGTCATIVRNDANILIIRQCDR